MEEFTNARARTHTLTVCVCVYHIFKSSLYALIRCNCIGGMNTFECEFSFWINYDSTEQTVCDLRWTKNSFWNTKANSWERIIRYSNWIWYSVVPSMVVYAGVYTEATTVNSNSHRLRFQLVKFIINSKWNWIDPIAMFLTRLQWKTRIKIEHDAKQLDDVYETGRTARVENFIRIRECHTGFAVPRRYITHKPIEPMCALP